MMYNIIMKLVCVVDSLTDIKNKLEFLSQFKSNTLFIVFSPFEEIVKTFGITPNAIYTNKLAQIMHIAIEEDGVEDTIIYYTSLNLTAELVNQFLKQIGNKNKVVNLHPKYNIFEKMYNSVYNNYVKGVFKLKDSLCSPKLQFLPKACVEELLSSHIANRMFMLKEGKSVELTSEDKFINKTSKPKYKFNKFHLIPIIVTLLLTAGLLTCLATLKPNFILIISFVALFILNIIIYTIFNFKNHFDDRFLK